MKIAIITGAGSGMGKDFAKLLDSEKLDEIWAISLDSEELDDLEFMLQTKVKKFALDLSKQKSIDNITEQLNSEKPNIKWLVNAAGFGKFNSCQNIKTETSLNMIDVNIKAIVSLTDASVPFMKKGSKIVNFSSVAGFQPVPYANIYAATKSFILSYSRALNFELLSKGISVTCVCPFWTKTEFFERAVDKDNKVIKKYVVMYDSKKVVQKAYRDSLNKKLLSIYGFVANAQVFLTKILPASLVCKIWLKQQRLPKKKVK